MATLYVTEFTGLANVASNFGAALMGAQAPLEPALVDQTVAIGGSSTPSNPFNANTTLVRVHSDAICSIAFGRGSATASATTRRLAANQTEYFGVPKGDGYVVAVITNT